MRIAAAALCAIACGGAQDPVDWADAVDKANTHRRFAVRVAAAKRVAQGGDEAIDAVEAFEREHGADHIQLALVEAIASGPERGDKTRRLLERWAADDAFYWRSQALRGLAVRALPELRDRFVAGLLDPSHLYRIESARGLWMLGEADGQALTRELLRDRDPRVRVAVALLLLEDDDRAGLGEIAATLRRTTAFLDDAWGEREAHRAARAVIAWAQTRLGQEGDFGYAEDPTAGRERLQELVSRHTEPAAAPVSAPVAEVDACGGLEIRSCRHGDLFLRWSADGRVWAGLEPDAPIRVDAGAWARLHGELAPGEGGGSVVCDFARLQDGRRGVDRKVAPGAAPAALLDWLKRLADTIENTGERDLSAQIRGRLVQFAPAAK